MNDMTKTVREFYKAVEGVKTKKGGGYDTQATVRRIEDGIAWVHIPDGVDETPAKLTISAKVGDVVQVRIVNGRAFLVGNASAPPTDNTEAFKAMCQAGLAAEAASIAWQKANEAVEDAATAHEAAMLAQDAADAAQQSADDAAIAANNAQTSATTANQAANSALAGLGTVESVLDVVTWFSEHKTATTDTTVQAGKSYYEYDASTGVLTKVDPEGTENPSEEGWYELDEAITNYVSTHLAQTNDGLYVVSSINGWRVLVSSGGGNYTAGVYLIDPNGNIAQKTTVGGVEFNTGRPVKIGDSTAYINFDGNGHINVIGASLTIGGANNTSGTLTVKDASGNTIGTWDNGGLYVTSLLNITSSDRTRSISLKYQYAGITKKTLTVDPTTNSQTQNSNLTYETLFTTDDLITGKLYSTGLFYSKVGAYIEGTTDLELLNCPQINTLTLYTFSLVAYGLLDSANIRATNTLTVQKATTGSNAYNSVNPRLDFKNADASQNIALIFTDYDSVQAPASLTLAGNQGGEYFIAPNIKATSAIYAETDIYIGRDSGTTYWSEIHRSNVHIQSTSNNLCEFRAHNTLGDISFQVSTTGNKGLWSYTDGKWIIYESASGTSVYVNGTNMIAHTSASPSYNSTYASGSSMTVRRWLNMVSFCGNITHKAVSTPSSGNLMSSAFETTYRPRDEIYFIDSNGGYKYKITTDGKFSLVSTTTTSAGTHYFSVTYLAQS